MTMTNRGPSLLNLAGFRPDLLRARTVKGAPAKPLNRVPSIAELSARIEDEQRLEYLFYLNERWTSEAEYEDWSDYVHSVEESLGVHVTSSKPDQFTFEVECSTHHGVRIQLGGTPDEPVLTVSHAGEKALSNKIGRTHTRPAKGGNSKAGRQEKKFLTKLPTML